MTPRPMKPTEGMRDVVAMGRRRYTFRLPERGITGDLSYEIATPFRHVDGDLCIGRRRDRRLRANDPYDVELGRPDALADARRAERLGQERRGGDAGPGQVRDAAEAPVGTAR